MKYGIYCIRDSLVGFMTPTLDQSDASAMRNFAMALDASKRDSSLMAFKPEHFDLYKLGIFDTETGAIDLVPYRDPICCGISLRRNSDEV